MSRKRIFHPRRNFGVHLAMDDFVALQLAQVFGQHFLIRAGNQALQLAEAARPALEIKQNQRLPLPTDQIGGKPHRTFEVFHMPPQRPGNNKVPTTERETLAEELARWLGKCVGPVR